MQASVIHGQYEGYGIGVHVSEGNRQWRVDTIAQFHAVYPEIPVLDRSYDRSWCTYVNTWILPNKRTKEYPDGTSQVFTTER